MFGMVWKLSETQTKQVNPGLFENEGWFTSKPWCGLYVVWKQSGPSYEPKVESGAVYINSGELKTMYVWCGCSVVYVSSSLSWQKGTCVPPFFRPIELLFSFSVVAISFFGD